MLKEQSTRHLASEETPQLEANHRKKNTPATTKARNAKHALNGLAASASPVIVLEPLADRSRTLKPCSNDISGTSLTQTHVAGVAALSLPFCLLQPIIHGRCLSASVYRWLTEHAVRSNIKVSKEIDLTLRTYLGALGMKKGDLSKFIFGIHPHSTVIQ
jgi:hypothetical protein